MTKRGFGNKISKRFKVVEKLGKGAFSHVFHCINRETGDHIAMKK
jgi:serine/threonine protein kinase